MKARKMAIAVAIAASIAPPSGSADCVSLVAHHGAARIEIRDAEPAQDSATHVRVRVTVISSVDAYIGNPENDPNRIEIELADSPFFEGEHISAVRCEHDVCSDLLEIDFASSIVEAQALLYSDCPDTGVAIHEVRLQFADIGSPEQPRFVPIMTVQER